MKKTKAILSMFAASLLVMGCGKKDPKDPEKPNPDPDSGTSVDVLKDLVAENANLSADNIQKDDVTVTFENYEAADITKIYSFENNDEVIAYGFETSATGYSTTTKIIFEVAYNVESNEIIGINIVSESETDGIGSTLLETESFLNQFKGLEIEEISDIDNQTGPTADITVSGIKTALSKVSSYYLTNMKEEEPVTVGYEDEEAAIKALFENEVTLNNVTSNYTDLKFNSYNELLAVYEVKEGETLVGYGFIATTTGLSAGLIHATAIDVETDTYLGLFAENNNEHYGKETLNNLAFLSQFINLPIGDVADEIDIETGVTQTIQAVKSSLTRIANFYNTNIKAA